MDITTMGITTNDIFYIVLAIVLAYVVLQILKTLLSIAAFFSIRRQQSKMARKFFNRR